MDSDRLTELLDTATAEVPRRYQVAPLTGIKRRVRRRRRATAVAVCVAVVTVLSGVAAAGAAIAGPERQHPTGPSSSPAPPALPWASAMVSRDERTVTVYAGATGCRDLVESRAEVTSQDAGRVVIAVYGRVVDAGDCSTAGQAVPVVVHLPADLGPRAVRDAAGGSHPTYYERNLPDLAASGWEPYGTTWSAADTFWSEGFNGPNGSSISLSAKPAPQGPHSMPPIVTTVDVGGHKGSVSGEARKGLSWSVYWSADGVRYSLQFLPAEGGAFTLNQFTHLLKTLKWS
jgi:hypothetical protein